jgi:hypothetical protein
MSQPLLVKEPRIDDKIVENISNFLGIGGREDEEGHCIRCGKKIPFNIKAPYCSVCYRTWAKYQDENFKEKYCIKCGTSEETSMKRPLCPSCYRKTK